LAKITLLFVLSLTYLWLHLRTVLLCAFNILFSAFTLSSRVHTVKLGSHWHKCESRYPCTGYNRESRVCMYSNSSRSQ